MTLRAAATLAALLALTGSAAAQSVNLTETPSGDCTRFTLDLSLAGNLVVVQENGKQPIRLEAKARHQFAERTLTAVDGLPAKTARHYDEAVASTVLGGEKINRTLPADRRLVVASQSSEGLTCYAPAGPVTRDELDLVTEHFNPQCLPGLLPGREVKVSDTWAITPQAAQAACLFDGLIKHALTGKLVEVKDGLAVFSVEGTAEGIEQGSKVSLTITATGRFDPTTKRVVELTWKQKDERDQGPVNPASQIEATVTLKREAVSQVPAELADAALAGLAQAAPQGLATALRHADPKGRYQFVYPREWHVTAQTEQHLVLRLIEKGEFITQATVSVWKKADPGKHATPEEFKKAVGESAGWQVERVLDDGELPTDGGRWLYRVTAAGKIQDIPAVQSFHLLAGPQGDQVAVTFAMKPEKVKAVGTRDASLVNAIEFGAKK